MPKNVLIVDDDRDLLLTLELGLEKYGRQFSVMTARDGEAAVEKLRGNTVSVVVTDLKMPRMDGYSLLVHIMGHFPDIHVIIMTAYGTAELERQMNAKGAVDYIEKPFLVEDLARKIIATLKKESEGGMLHGFTTGVFAQLVEMEQKTCTLRVVDRDSGKKGVLFFRNGELLDARLDGITGDEAALIIFSWDRVSLSIQNECRATARRIEGDLQRILLEAMRRKDEAGALEE